MLLLYIYIYTHTYIRICVCIYIYIHERERGRVQPRCTRSAPRQDDDEQDHLFAAANLRTDIVTICNII